MLADAQHVMPDSLKFEGDKLFFEQALDRVDLIVHGRNSHEQQTNSPKRKRLILTRKIKALTVDPEQPKATLWNPDHAAFEEACAFAGVTAGTIAINVKALKGSPFIRLRVGDWRVVMDDRRRVLSVLKVGPRGGVYD